MTTSGDPFDVSHPHPNPSGGDDPTTFSPEELEAALSGPPPTLGRARAPRNRQRTGAWPPAGAPRVAQDSLESVADDVAFWIETTAKEVAGAMYDGVHAPFAARIGPQEAARYYAETLFNTDGTLNPERWRKEYARVGPAGLANAIRTGAAYRQRMGLRVNLPMSRFQPVGEGYVGVTPAAGSIEGAAPSEGEEELGEPAGADRSVSEEY